MPDEHEGGPAVDEPLELDVIPTPSASPGDAAPVVVVIDDDADIRGIIVRSLGPTHTVYEASDGEEAFALLQAIPAPDAIVCDVMMPKLDGLALAKLLRKDAVLKRVPILFLTARGAPLDVVAGINAGARHYVTKPFKVADLVAKVTAMAGAAKK
ncbi:MAG: response regulator [Myxococcota bacterium]|nr:response regulator [Myxococcota bacterium]